MVKASIRNLMTLIIIAIYLFKHNHYYSFFHSIYPVLKIADTL